MTVRGLVSGLLASACALVWAATAAASPSGVVVSQVYGGGGNTGATYTHDFVELYNAGSTPVSLDGWSVQYASARPARALRRNRQLTELTGTIAAGPVLPRPAGAGRRRNDAAPDARRDRRHADRDGAGAGKVALVRSTAASAATGTGCPLPAPRRDRGPRRVRHRDERRELLRGRGCRADAARTRSPRSARWQRRDRHRQQRVRLRHRRARPAQQHRSASQATERPRSRAVTPANGATEVARTTNLTVTFSEAVNAAPGAFTLTCAQTGARTLAVTGNGTASYTLDPTADLGEGETCTATVQRGRHLGRRHDRPARRDGRGLHVVVHDDASAPDQDDRRGAGRRSPTPPTATPTAPRSRPRRATAPVRPSTVRGVIFQKTITRTAAGAIQRGFFIQNLPSYADSDPTTSDALFVFMGTFTTLIGGYRRRSATRS